MRKYKVAKVKEFTQVNGEINPIIVDVEGVTLGIYKFNGRYFAYENECAHEGGPALEGSVVGDVVCQVSAEGRKLAEYSSETKKDIICPWHGVAYDLETGMCKGDESLRLVSHEVFVEGDDIEVRL